jgi:hypothetical protein
MGFLRPENPAAAAIAAASNGAAPSGPIFELGSKPHPFRTAMEARDIDAVVATLRPDVVALSPVTPQPFVGIYEVAGLVKNLIDGFEELEYTDELAGGDVHAIAFRGRVLGRVVTGVDLLRLDEDGRIRRIEVSGRPPVGVFAMAGKFSPMFATWRRGRIRAFLLTLLLRGAPLLAVVMDAIGSRLARVPARKPPGGAGR